MPRLAIAVALLMLAALAGTLGYAGYLAIGVLAGYIGTGRFVAGLLLGVILAKIPWVRNGKLRTGGLLPKAAHLSFMVSLLTGCMLHFLYQDDMVAALFLGFAAVFLLVGQWMRKAVLSRIFTASFKSPAPPNRSTSSDDTVIDGEFREKK